MNPEKRAKLDFASKAVYIPPDETSKSINPPIFMSSSFQYDADIYQQVVDGERKSVQSAVSSCRRYIVPVRLMKKP